MIALLRPLFVHDERGASAVEYGLLIAGIAAIIAVAVFTFGDTVSDVLFTTSCQTITSNVGGSTACNTP